MKTKKYKEIALVSTPYEDYETFQKNVAGHVANYQEKGLTVEVQFKPNETKLAALVLGYEMEVIQ